MCEEELSLDTTSEDMAQIHQAFWRNVRQIENLRHLNAFVTENIKSASEMCSLSVERHENGMYLLSQVFSLTFTVCLLLSIV